VLSATLLAFVSKLIARSARGARSLLRHPPGLAGSFLLGHLAAAGALQLRDACSGAVDATLAAASGRGDAIGTNGSGCFVTAAGFFLAGHAVQGLGPGGGREQLCFSIVELPVAVAMLLPEGELGLVLVAWLLAAWEAWSVAKTMRTHAQVVARNMETATRNYASWGGA